MLVILCVVAVKQIIIIPKITQEEEIQEEEIQEEEIQEEEIQEEV
jgi:competence protein ComGC